MKCRHCGEVLRQSFIDLGFAPPSNAYLNQAKLNEPELYYPLRVSVCGRCWLVQTEDYARASELFTEEYAYFSSTSTSWLQHAARYAAQTMAAFSLDADALVVEIGCNDGYLLRNFKAAGVPCLGIEPTEGTASAASALGIPVVCEFFGEKLAARLAASRGQADLLIGNNVYAHVPDINDFTKGLKVLLKRDGIITLEFPHFLRLLQGKQFDTIYHEHFSYLSLCVVEGIFKSAGLRIWDVETLPTHGGSLRIYGCHADSSRADTSRVGALRNAEKCSGLQEAKTYSAFQSEAERIKDELLHFLIEQKRAGRRVAAYGAAAKGNTLLNFAGIKSDLIPFVCDAAVSKQGKFLPGSHIPICAPEKLIEFEPEFLIVLPWNILEEVKLQHQSLRQKGTKFVTAVPALNIQAA